MGGLLALLAINSAGQEALSGTHTLAYSAFCQLRRKSFMILKASVIKFFFITDGEAK
jgi:hypothetical protein